MCTPRSLVLFAAAVAACSVDRVHFIAPASGTEACHLAGDEDGNGLADCADPACATTAGCEEGCGVASMCDRGLVAREITCTTLAPRDGTCEVTPGGANTLIQGTVLTSSVVYQGGQVAVDAEGRITCVGCDCATGGETTIVCPDAVISPGLIDAHEHIVYAHSHPLRNAGWRYEDRQQWRLGADEAPPIEVRSGATNDEIAWGELRFLLAGVTSLVGQGGRPGLVRNLDQLSNQEGLGHAAVRLDTFPLDDVSGIRRTGDCDYGGRATTAEEISAVDAYVLHTSEGINEFAHNEFLCQSSTSYDQQPPGVSNALTRPQTAMVHGIGLQPADLATMAATHTGLVWSPRSNLALYGDTARVTTADRAGVKIALGTDWLVTGSMNLLRELACADHFNAVHLGRYFRAQRLWEMVTVNAAAMTATGDVLGDLAAGKLADLVVFAAHGRRPFRAVIEAKPQDVALVLRGGKPLYGDDSLLAALAPACEPLTVCGADKRLCVMTEIGKSLVALQANVGTSSYPLFACEAPPDEPSCTPTRASSISGSTIYTGAPDATDQDGDGLPDEIDNCPRTFNPIRPMDRSAQGDVDHDGAGDECDACPLDPDPTCVMSSTR